MKICSICKQSKDFLAFGKHKGHADGLQSSCKICRQSARTDKQSEAYYKGRYQRDKEEMKVQAKIRYEANKEHILPRNAEYKKEWDRENPEKKSKYFKNWCAKYPEKRRLKDKTRQKRFRTATPKWLTKEQKNDIKFFYIIAENYTKITGIQYHVDHIIPLKGEIVSGLHVPWNLQVITKQENLRKGNFLQE